MLESIIIGIYSCQFKYFRVTLINSYTVCVRHGKQSMIWEVCVLVWHSKCILKYILIAIFNLAFWPQTMKFNSVVFVIPLEVWSYTALWQCTETDGLSQCRSNESHLDARLTHAAAEPHGRQSWSILGESSSQPLDGYQTDPWNYTERKPNYQKIMSEIKRVIFWKIRPFLKKSMVHNFLSGLLSLLGWAVTMPFWLDFHHAQPNLYKWFRTQQYDWSLVSPESSHHTSLSLYLSSLATGCSLL